MKLETVGKQQHRVGHSRKDNWDRITAAWPVLIALVGGVYTFVENRAHDRDARIQMLRQREDNELRTRGAVFQDLTNRVLNEETQFESRLLALETLMYNFHSVFNGRNLFQALSDRIDTCANSHKPLCTPLEDHNIRKTMKMRLQSIAQAVSRVQKSMIKSTMGEDGDVQCLRGGAPEVTLENTVIVCSAKYKGHVHKVLFCKTTNRKDDPADSVRIGMLVVDEGLPQNREEMHQACSTWQDFETACRAKDKPQPDFCGSFALSAFGTPFSDNTGLSDGHRIALLLKDPPTEEIKDLSKHQIEIIEFPDDFLPPGYRPTLTVVDRMGR